jgi:hypothetical protein
MYQWPLNGERCTHLSDRFDAWPAVEQRWLWLNNGNGLKMAMIQGREPHA